MIAALAEPLAWAHRAAIDLVRWVAGFDFLDLRIEHELVSLRSADGYPVLGGRIVSDRGLDIDVSAFDAEFSEAHVAHSTALHGRRRPATTYLTGPLARWANNRDRVPPEVDALADELGVPPVERNPFRSIVIRGLEVLLAVIEAEEIVAGYGEPGRRLDPGGAGSGCGVGSNRGPARDARASVRDRCGRDHPRCSDHSPDVAEPTGDRSRRAACRRRPHRSSPAR